MSLIDGETIINSIMVYIILYILFLLITLNYVYGCPNTIACESSSIIINGIRNYNVRIYF